MRHASQRERLHRKSQSPFAWTIAAAIFWVAALAGGMWSAVRAQPEDPAAQRVLLPFGPKLPGSAVYPHQELRLRFDHGLHLARGMPCDSCHTHIAESQRPSDHNFPRGVTCDPCHGKQHPRPADVPSGCEYCHTQVSGDRVVAGLHAPPARLHFSHAAHGKRGIGCETCHGDMQNVKLATAMQLPREATCLECHDGKQASDRCDVCHPSRASGVLLTRPWGDRSQPPLMPTGRNRFGMAHDLAFVREHRGPAKARPDACQACHEQTFCLDCHAGTVRPFRIHGGDYLRQHGAEASNSSEACRGCHNLQAECRACHIRVGFGRTGPSSQFGVGAPLRFHPAGWVGGLGAPQGHAAAAKRQVNACASCHDEDTCLACHATTDIVRPGLGASPHGPNFAKSARCRALEARNRRVCLKCHAPGDPLLGCP